MKTFIRPVTVLVIAAFWFASGTVPARAQPPSTEGQLTMSSLKMMIENLGYEFKEFKNDKGVVNEYLLTVPRGGANWKIFVTISPNQENVWVFADLAPIADLNNVPRDILVDMLKANETMGPTYFAYNEKIKLFVLYHVVTNRGVTAKLLRERVESVANQVDVKEKLWNPKLWSGTGPGPEPVKVSPEVAQLMKDLDSPNEMVRLKAAKDLGKFGAAAKTAIPALQRLLKDPDEDVRRIAATAIDRIQNVTGPGPGPGPATVVGTTWEGNETLSGYGRVKFQFDADGKATMYDAMWEKRGTVSGSWTQVGDQVTISFKDCVYEGTIKGDVLSGNARFVESGVSWTFSVSRLDVTTRAAPGGKPAPSLANEGGRRR